MKDPRTKEWALTYEKRRAFTREHLIKAGTEEKNLDAETNEVMIEVAKMEAEKDFFFFMDMFLECSKLSRRFHGALCDFMQNDAPEKLILCPRGHLKSTVCTVGYALWRIVKNPEIRILICNYKLANAEAFVGQMKSMISSRMLFNYGWKDLWPETRTTKWNSSAFTITRQGAVKEATIECAGVGTEVTGRHYDLIIFDDVMGPENTTTKEQVQKVRTWFNQMQFVLEPDGQQVVIGTRWDFEDIYGWILESQVPPFKVFKTGIFEADGETPIWPEKFSVERIKRIEEKMAADPKVGRSIFVKQYLNEVMDEEGAPFKRCYLTEFEQKDIPQSLAISITCDPAIGEKANADFAAISVRGVDDLGRWWVLEVWKKRNIEPLEMIDKLFSLYQEWTNRGYSVDAVGVEFIAYQKSLKFMLRDEMFKRNVFLPLVELLNSRSNKESRISGLVPRWAQRGILIPSDRTDGIDELLDEMFRFPNSKHDDCLDSLAMHDELSIVPKSRKTKIKQVFRRDRYTSEPEKEEAGNVYFL